MPNSPTEKSGKCQINLNLRKEIVEKFRLLCANERRPFNAQMEIILEGWFAANQTGVEYQHPVHEVLKIAEEIRMQKKKGARK